MLFYYVINSSINKIIECIIYFLLNVIGKIIKVRREQPIQSFWHDNDIPLSDAKVASSPLNHKIDSTI
ncbi:hypothetical protein D3C80_1996280 [compost metagenome]